MRRLISLSLALMMVLSLFLVTPVAQAAETTGGGYYRRQLATAEARGIYDALEKMRDTGYMKNGVYTVDLVAEKYLQNKFYEKNVLMADFIAARDAFMLDNAALFYVDFDKLSITASQSGSNYSITLGVGRDSTYFRQGFDANTVGTMIRAFEGKVEAIATSALKQETMSQRVRAAFDGVIAATSYALEKDAAPANVNYVRTPYGALVRGQSVCEGYARALKAVLDKMDIENVLVQGTFADGSFSGLHMWNYVRMDNGRWYLLDATMEDGLRSSTDVPDSDDFFLKTALDGVVACYQPEGKISLSAQSFTFRYPDLDTAEYEDLTNAFTAEVIDNRTQKVSYRGKGILKTKETGKYILASLDNQKWYYYENYVKLFIVLNTDQDPSDLMNDQDGYFTDIFSMSYFAVTEKAPPAGEPYIGMDYDAYQDYVHGRQYIKEISQVAEAVEYSKRAPYIIEKTPSDSRVKAGDVIDVTLKYSEPLQLANSGSEAGIRLTSPNNLGSVSGFSWNGTDTITFKLTIGQSYGYNTIYHVTPVNLVSGGMAPAGTSFYVLNTPVFSCPKVASSISNIHSNIPALITDSNLAENEWKDENGNPIANYASNRLALVASPIPETSEAEDQITQETMKEAINELLPGGSTVKAAQTFDISLTLCSGQVEYITGKRVKVFVPFPTGYSYDSLKDTTFKAYHFDKNGNAEEIDCVVTESGIIMMCSAFSPFAVIATQKVEEDARKVMLYSDGNGSYLDSQGETLELVKVPSGQSVDITVTAKEGYTIESILVNGKSVSTKARNVRTVGQQTTITLTDSELLDSGNVVETTFALANVQAGGTDLVVGISVPAGVTLTAPDGGWVEDAQNSFTVAGETPCVVLISENDGRTYTRLTGAAGETAYTFTTTITASTTITVLPAGDINGDGSLTNADVTTLNAIWLGKRATDSLSRLLVDTNGDGKVSNADVTRLNAAYLGKRPMEWN